MAKSADDIILKHAEGLTFADIGGLWGTVNERVTVALSAGAKSATMIDEQPASNEWWQRFDARACEKGWEGRYTSLEANLDDPTLPGRIGTFDFVHCAGVIYHAPSPFHMLMRLRALTNKYLILGSLTVPQRIETDIGEIDMSDGAAYFIPALSGSRLGIFKKHWTDLQVAVHNVTTVESYDWMINDQSPNYGPWWWFWTAETLGRMAETAGFEIVSIEESWENRAHNIFLKTRD